VSDNKRIFFLRHDEARRGVAAFAAVAPEGWKVTFEPPKRNLDINAALHATLGEIAARVEWAGRRRSIECWKRLLVASWMRAVGEQVEMLPALDGHGVDIVYSPTSEMTQDQMRDLMGFVDAWKAERPEFQTNE
jgi:NinB protein